MTIISRILNLEGFIHFTNFCILNSFVARLKQKFTKGTFKRKFSCKIGQDCVCLPTINCTVNVKPTFVSKEAKTKWRRIPSKEETKYKNLENDFTERQTRPYGEKGALEEATRCLKCSDAPCEKTCPVSIDVKHFISCIANKNYYGAAKAILSNNPLGITCGVVCPTLELCQGSCNLNATEQGGINIGGLQSFVVEIFHAMNVKQTLDPNTPKLRCPNRKISIVGAGPASLSCATFLARLGYRNITIYEKEAFAGGVIAAEVPQYRLPIEKARLDINLVAQLGVKFEFGRKLSSRGLTLQNLLDCSEVVFIGIGKPDPREEKLLRGLDSSKGVYTAKEFLTKVGRASKKNLTGNNEVGYEFLPDMKGKLVTVIGPGETGLDCACCALRCGAKKSFLIARRGLSQVTSSEEETTNTRKEKVEFIGMLAMDSIKFVKDKNDTIESIVFKRLDYSDDPRGGSSGSENYTLKTDCIVLSIGAVLKDKDVIDALHPLKLNKSNTPEVDRSTLRTSHPKVWCGGDIGGHSGLVVEAVNDGKTAAWQMHCAMEGLCPESTPCSIPLFHTDIDEIDLSQEICGLNFCNPFGVSSGPPTGSISMIRRAFQQGWGFAVTKTVVKDKDLITEVSPRLSRGTNHGPHYGPHQKSFLHIELVGEKYLHYWLSGINQLKCEFPEKILIASMLCSYNEEDWRELSRLLSMAGADALELNLFYPWALGKSGPALATDPQMIRNVCCWVTSSVCIPVFVKFPGVVTDVITLAKAAREGGASGVTAISAGSSIMDVRSDGKIYPFVGCKQTTSYGGVSGDILRPLGLKTVSFVANKFPEFTILGSGGISSADAAFQYLQCGAHLFQVCSAVMNQDLTIIDDFVTGLKTLLYLDGKKTNWDGQSPPTYKHQKGKPVQTFRDRCTEGTLPAFGPYLQERQKQMESFIKKSTDMPPIPHHCGKTSGYVGSGDGENRVSAAKLETVRGRALFKISRHEDLDRNEQVVAEIDEDLCINCGKCYLACSDAGYQAIWFEDNTHIPKVTERCTGCALCMAVCPIIDCIIMVPKQGSHMINRSDD